MKIEIILLVLAGFFTIVTGILAYLQRKDIIIKDNEELTERANFYVGLLLKSIDMVVVSLNQTLVDKLKADNDGKLSKDEALQVYKEAEQMVLKTLTDEGKEMLNHVIGDVPKFIKMGIEASVKKNK